MNVRDMGRTRLLTGNFEQREASIVTRPASSAAAAMPQAAAEPVEPMTTDEQPLSLGMSRDDVRGILGDPDTVSDDGARWGYGSHVLIFTADDRLCGEVAFDPIQAGINKANNLAASIASAGKSSRGPRILRASQQRSSNWVRAGYRSSVGPGSARGDKSLGYRQGTRYNGYGYQANSYYMNDSGPGYRPFYQQPALPRGMSRGSSRSLSSFGNLTYGVGSLNTYRR